jgi:hypothetical protein
MRKLRSGLCVCAVVLGALGAAATAQAQQQFNEHIYIETGDTPRIRLAQTSQQGWQPYFWEVAANEINFFVRDGETSDLPFRVRSRAPDRSLVVESTGRVSMPGGATSIARATERVNRGEVGNETDVDHAELLEAIRSLPVPEWEYLSEPGEARHIGPLAEDFHAAFGLGSGGEVAPGDVAGVALAAAQALQGEQRTLERENKKLRKKVSRLGKKLAKQGKLLRRLQRKIK